MREEECVGGEKRSLCGVIEECVWGARRRECRG